MVQQEGKKILLPIDEIIFCKAWDYWSIIYLKDGENRSIPYTLKQIEMKLSNTEFIRIHRSYLVNIIHIEEIIGNYEQIIVKNNYTLPISRRNRCKIKNVFC